MFEGIMRRIRDKVRKKQYVVTLHADEEMNADGLTIFDVEEIVFTGKIGERQVDSVSGEFKYVVTGQTLAGFWASAVTKLSVTEKVVFITVYVES